MRIRKKQIIILACIALAVAIIGFAVMSSQAKSDYYGSRTGTVITEKRLPEVSQVLRQAGLSNVDLFETWVYEYFEGKDANDTAYSDTDSRMTAMLLADDQVRCEDRKEYKGDLLREDVEKIEREDGFIFIRDNLDVFTALFGEMPVSDKGAEETLPENWKKHDMEFLNEQSSIVSVVSGTKDGKECFVSHTGILIDTKGMEPSPEKRFLFVEKLDYGDAFYATELEDTEGLMELLSSRGEEASKEWGKDQLVYINDEYLGELHN